MCSELQHPGQEVLASAPLSIDLLPPSPFGRRSFTVSVKYRASPSAPLPFLCSLQPSVSLIDMQVRIALSADDVCVAATVEAARQRIWEEDMGIEGGSSAVDEVVIVCWCVCVSHHLRVSLVIM